MVARISDLVRRIRPAGRALPGWRSEETEDQGLFKSLILRTRSSRIQLGPLQLVGSTAMQIFQFCATLLKYGDFLF